MVQVIKSFGDASIGDVATLKSGGPDMTVIGFEGPEPVTPVAGNFVGVAHVEAEPVARVAWVTSDGVAHVHRYPLEALTLKAKADKKDVDPLA